MRKAYSYIRMSTETQLSGDSLRRQCDASKAYAQMNDLELIETIDGRKLNDLGISAFNGKNAVTGSLSVFLAALENGKIEPNSVLLIESLDRLSRDKLSDALIQFLNIISKNIEIITLIDNQRYTKETIDKNSSLLFISLASMLRANDESETKSKRLRAAWGNKRANIDKKILTSLCPAWLQYSDTSKVFEFIPERKKIVELIFDMCINSGGLYSIARHLNENHIPVFGRGKIWHRSYIKKIINNRSVIGEFQLHEMIDGKRCPSGDPIKNYFPKIFQEQQFLLAQVAISRRTKVSKGRKGAFFSNLFSGITYCGKCQSKMSVRNHGNAQKGGRFLVCANKHMNAGCDTMEWNLEDFYDVIFPHLKELKFDDLIQEKNEKADSISLTDRRDALTLKLNSKEEELNRTLNLITSKEFIFEIKNQLILRSNNLQLDINNIRSEIGQIANEISDEATSKDINNSTQLKELLEKIDQNKEDYNFRSSVNQLLIRMIEKIELIDSTSEFMPWEMNENNFEVQNFRQTFPIRLNRPLDEILNCKEFEKFCKIQHRKLKITYKTGAIRRVLWGEEVSFGGYHRK